MNDEEKWAFLQAAPTRDAQDPELQRLAARLWEASGANALRFAQLAHTVARDWVKYKTDSDRVGSEDIAGLTRAPTPTDATDALRRGVDDCDAKARLFVALCLAANVAARMMPGWTPCARSATQPNARALSHVSAAVLLGGRWLPVETTLARARIGEEGKAVPVEKDTGKWRLS